jgi:hypothetical protein
MLFEVWQKQRNEKSGVTNFSVHQSQLLTLAVCLAVCSLFLQAYKFDSRSTFSYLLVFKNLNSTLLNSLYFSSMNVNADPNQKLVLVMVV